MNEKEKIQQELIKAYGDLADACLIFRSDVAKAQGDPVLLDDAWTKIDAVIWQVQDWLDAREELQIEAELAAERADWDKCLLGEVDGQGGSDF